MGKISLLAPWLQRIFPPAELPGSQPLEVSGDISYVHQVFSGNDEIPMEVIAILGGAGVTAVSPVTAAANEYLIVHAVHYSHNDPIARTGIFQLGHPNGNTFIEEGVGVSTTSNVTRGYGKTILVPALADVRISVPSLAAAQTILAQAAFTRVPIGHPHQHF